MTDGGDQSRRPPTPARTIIGQPGQPSISPQRPSAPGAAAYPPALGTPMPPPAARRSGEVSAGVNLAPGTRIHQYELIRELGRGGMGCVYVARDTKLGRRVAMKFLLNASKSVADRFLVEARATARCNHENIVIIHEVNEHDSRPYMVLEFLEGQTLRGAMERGPLPVLRAVELMIPVARALVRAHETGILHRDLKPENIFLTGAGLVKVLDFGIAKADVPGTDSGAFAPPRIDDASLDLTQEGSVIGTLPFMAPEQFAGDDVDPRADLWAAGIILYWMIAGHHPLDPLSEPVLLNSARAL
ncbi:MAG TPA: serine/threonine-protein kinase, partial [Kofleriaceae bacterium]|nr:serine/threonine-protein kinase [Kofleriaceae bacterium]